MTTLYNCYSTIGSGSVKGAGPFFHCAVGLDDDFLIIVASYDLLDCAQGYNNSLQTGSGGTNFYLLMTCKISGPYSCFTNICSTIMIMTPVKYSIDWRCGYVLESIYIFGLDTHLLYFYFFAALRDPLERTASENETDTELDVMSQQRLLEEDTEGGAKGGEEAEPDPVKPATQASSGIKDGQGASPSIPEGRGEAVPMDTSSPLKSRSRCRSSPAPSNRTGATSRSRGLSLRGQDRDRSYSPTRSERSSSTATSIEVLEEKKKEPNSGFVGSLYGAIKKLRNAALAPRTLGGSKPPAEDRYGHLVGKRKEGSFYRHIYEARANVSCSFDPSTLKCHVCEWGAHSVLHSELDIVPKCFILSDQANPPILAALHQDRSCIAVLRVEDAAPAELVDIFRKITESKNLQVGSVILVSSLSHLGRSGTDRYIEDIADAIRSLEDDFKGKVRILHGLPIPQSDVDDSTITRKLFDTISWLRETDTRHQYHLPATAQFYMDRVLSAGADEPVAPGCEEPLSVKLLTSIKSRDKSFFYSAGRKKLVATLGMPTRDVEADFYEHLALELNQNYALNLETKPVLDVGMQEISSPSWTSEVNLIIGGGSHASRLARAMRDDFPNLVDLTMCGWKLSEDSAADLAEDIKEQTPANLVEKTVIILQLFDNAVYKGQSSTGRITEPWRQDGCYHVEGDLVTVGEEEFKYLFTAAAPAIRAAKKCQVLLLTPLYRYATGRCCQNASHITNFAEPYFTRRLGLSLQAIGKQLRTLVWQRHWRSVSVINPAAHMGIGVAGSMTGEEADLAIGDLLRLWGNDPVHPTDAAYAQLAESLKDKICSKLSTVPARAPERERRRRPSPDGPDRRISWVRESNTEVSRAAGPSGNAGQRFQCNRFGGYQRSAGSGMRGNAGLRGGPSGNAGPRGGPSGNAGRHKRPRRGF